MIDCLIIIGGLLGSFALSMFGVSSFGFAVDVSPLFGILGTVIYGCSLGTFANSKISVNYRVRLIGDTYHPQYRRLVTYYNYDGNLGKPLKYKTENEAIKHIDDVIERERSDALDAKKKKKHKKLCKAVNKTVWQLK